MVIPIILPDINIDNVLSAAKHAVGNVSRVADKSTRPLNVYERYLSALSCLQNKDSDLTHSIQNVSVQKHLSFAFLIFEDEDTISKSMEFSGLSHSVFDTKKKRVKMAIVSGTLAEFRDAIPDCSAIPDLAELYDQIYLAFEAAGFRQVFNFKKTQQGHTFKLESR